MGRERKVEVPDETEQAVEAFADEDEVTASDVVNAAVGRLIAEERPDDRAP